MRGFNHENGSLGFRLLTTVLLFGLLAEWMLPWLRYGEWADVYQVGPLLVVVGCVMIAGLFRPTWYMSLLMNGVLCLITLMLLFKGDDQNALQWLVHYPQLLVEDIKQLFTYGMWTMSNELRTLLLFVGWAMLAPALQALVWMRQVALGLTAITAAYLLTLHIWVGMDVFDGLLRTSAEGLLLGAVVTIARVKRLHGGSSEYDRQIHPKWLAAGEFLVLLCVGIGMLLSSGQPRQTEPAAWTVTAANRLEQAMVELGKADYSAAMQAAAGTAGQKLSVTGYGFDDSELGASITPDDTVVFNGFSPVQTYWRGESKSIYDGRGWSNSWSGKMLHPVENGDKLSEVAISTDGDDRLIKQTVVMKEPSAAQGLPLFFAGSSGRVVSLSAIDPNRQLSTYVEDELADTLYAADKGAKVERYTVESRLPVTDVSVLRSSDHSTFEGNTAALNTAADEADLSEYLLLPDSIPDRVKALADEIAGAGMTSQYDRVKAVEQYLKNNYNYSLDSAVPPKGADFVDYFLFEQLRGYCVHFSSAMVVLLREEGIPSRWVKGFVSGTPVSTAGFEETSVAGTLYNVRAKDAHAWVEVYFPGVGWVPFDPTPGFAGGMGPVDADAGINAASDGLASAGNADATAPEHAGSGTDGMLARVEAAAERAASAVSRGADALAEAAQSAASGAAAASAAAIAAAGAAALVLAAALAAAAQRKRLRLALALRRYHAAHAAGRAAAVQEQFAAVSAATWVLLGRRILVRPPQHTAREYADAVSASIPGARADALRRFIAWDDAARFGQRGDWQAPPPEELAAAIQALLGKLRSTGTSAAVHAAE
jgi:transglutaminase-like putative cysteine protease